MSSVNSSTDTLLRDRIDFTVPPRKLRKESEGQQRSHRNAKESGSERRQVFLTGLDRQIKLARNPAYTYSSVQFVQRDGQTLKETVRLTPKPWWYEENGLIYLRLNFGERTWLIPGKNPVIRIGSQQQLLPMLEGLRSLVIDGEFDDVIESMVIHSR